MRNGAYGAGNTIGKNGGCNTTPNDANNIAAVKDFLSSNGFDNFLILLFVC